MNRETSIYSSDTLVVVDGSRRRRQLVIVAAVAALVLFVIGLAVLSSHRSNSNGAAGNGTTGGRGIAGMRQRVTALDGTFDAGPRPGRGFRVRARFPTRDEAR